MEKGEVMATMTAIPSEYGETLIERVERLTQPCERPMVWGNPLLPSTPQSLAILDLALRVEALETSLHEIATTVQRFIDN
jgi:hypothetical protein